VTGGPADRPSPRKGLSGHVVWVDAQLPPSLAHWLSSEHGERASHVQDLGLLHVSDSGIFDAAVRLDEPVVLVTKDADFVDLLHHRGPPPVLVWLRTGNMTNRELRRIISAAWARTTGLVLVGEPLVEIRREAAGTHVADVDLPGR
jgi:predicted nuclease of predicted toxin-antitoxin system